MSFEIKLPLFKGPFDLLLFFIERDELDIYDIPISSITNEFLSYIHHLEKMNMEVASEFILVAATLMRIKAKMLLLPAGEKRGTCRTFPLPVCPGNATHQPARPSEFLLPRNACCVAQRRVS